MLVELDVFSGRSNPRWELDDPGVRQLRRLLRRVTSSTAAPPEPPALGYRGFLFTDTAGPCRAYQGYLRTSRGAWADPSLSVERFLLDRLPAEFAAIRRRIASDLGRPQ